MMIDTLAFVRGLGDAGIRFVTGVPDSLLSGVCACIANNVPADRHVIATNEGSAIALAIGHYLATSNPALVYMQNSGLGNAINPLVSLADPLVYGIPMVLLIGWRGELRADDTQLHDEPQHVKQGRITLAQLDVLDVPYRVLDADTLAIEGVLREVVSTAVQRHGATALVVRKGAFSPFKLATDPQAGLALTRESALRAILATIPPDWPIISTTGKASRELFELRAAAGEPHTRDFLTVGGMGHASQIAAGIAQAQRGRKVVCIDGDGAALMHMGALAISADCPNLVHIVINNETHDSVGGQPTKGNVLHFDKIASVLGYAHTDTAMSDNEVQAKLAHLLTLDGSVLFEVRCKRGAREDLGRPDRTPAQAKADFMQFLERGNG